MKRRWIIRGFFVCLLTLCVGGWILSYEHCWQINYVGRDYWMGQCSRGKVYLNWWDSRTMSFASYQQGWSVAVVRPNAGFDSLLVREYGGRFHFGFYVGSANDEWWITIPLWLPTTFAAITLVFLWRKTRPKHDPKTAFPVDVKRSVERKS